MGNQVFEQEKALGGFEVETALEHEGAHALTWHTSYWPFVISFGILFLIPIAFMFHFVYKNDYLSVLSLGIGAPLTLISIIGWVREGMEDAHGYGAGHSVWAMPLFIVAEALLFIGFFIGYWVLRLSSPAWPPAGTPEMKFLIPVVMTAILLLSSVTIHIAEGKIEGERADRSGFLMWLVITLILGAAFLGLSAYEWSELIGEGFGISKNIYSTAFYSITGFHGSHVMVGLGLFVCMLLPALSGKINIPFVKAASMYWHFVDVVWLFVVSQVYFW